MAIPPASIVLSLSTVLATLRQHLLGNRYVLIVNGLFLGLLMALALNAMIHPYGGAVIERLFKEPFSIKYPYLGFLVLASEILWGATGAICLFTFVVLRHVSPTSLCQRFLLCSGLVTTLLVFDDTFRVTTWLSVTHSVPKLLSYVVYGLAAIAIGITFHPTIRKTPYLLLALAGLLFCFSAGVDLLALPGQGMPAMLEDGSKLLGIINISLYYGIVCQTAILSQLQTQR